ncbi:hypothetical protein J6590_021306 [Homalodisca vitripennis]|nr:hypothetical protein J6590_021306 [Homalodisca vitripennis]
MGWSGANHLTKHQRDYFNPLWNIMNGEDNLVQIRVSTASRHRLRRPETGTGAKWATKASPALSLDSAIVRGDCLGWDFTFLVQTEVDLQYLKVASSSCKAERRDVTIDPGGNVFYGTDTDNL